MNTHQFPQNRQQAVPNRSASSLARPAARPVRPHRAGTFSGGSSERQGAAVGWPRSTGRGAFWPGARLAITETLGGIGLCLALVAVLSLADTLPDVIVGAFETPAPEPECREQFTPDTRFVRHCNFHDGRGWVEAP